MVDKVSDQGIKWTLAYMAMALLYADFIAQPRPAQFDMN